MIKEFELVISKWVGKTKERIMPVRKSEENHIDPIIFVNTPIESEDADVIGLESSVAAVKSAINDGARMIGVIAEYGAGKSSLTELITSSKEYGKPIHINMWDSLDNEGNSRDSNVSDLVKTFIYQLALGKSETAAGYVNKLLSNNYKNISFGIGHNKFWLFSILAGISWAVYLITKQINVFLFRSVFVNSGNWGGVIRAIAPVFAVMAVVFLVVGLANTSITFSSWKDTDKRNVTTNEVLAAYSYVNRELSQGKKHRIVVIDDLDRVENKDQIISFLKELYRFNNLCPSTNKNDPVFLVSIAPETELETELKDKNNQPVDNNHKPGDEPNYSKVFDYVISLKPIHYDDYRTIIKQLLNSDAEKKERLLNISGGNDENALLDIFKWLYSTENITIRELKERLNQAIGRYIELKNKGYVRSSIDLQTCVCVTFLERNYPHDFISIVNNEKAFSDLIQKSYSYRNKTDIDAEKKFEEEVDKGLGKKEINMYIAKMIFNGQIDTDYRMYFYTFPKSSYIKNIDEKEVCNYLELPQEYDVFPEIEEKMGRIVGQNRTEKIFEIIDRIADDKTETVYSEVVLEDNTLFTRAKNDNLEKCVATLDLNFYITKDEQKQERILSNNKKYLDEDSDRDNYWEKYLSLIVEKIDESKFDEPQIVFVRKLFIRVFQEDILRFRILFMGNESNGIPIITREELKIVSPVKNKLALIDENLIDDDNYVYIEDLLKNGEFDKETIDSACVLQKAITGKIKFNLIAKNILDFMKKNRLCDEDIFSELCNTLQSNEELISKADICGYVNDIDESKISGKCYTLLNGLGIEQGLNSSVIDALLKQKLYLSPLLCMVKTKDFSKINFDNDIGIILEACAKINEQNNTYIKEIRKWILSHNEDLFYKSYKDLCSNDYKIISIEELGSSTKFIDSLACIDASQFDQGNITEYIDYINRAERKGNDCYEIFNHCFSSDNDDICDDAQLIDEFVYRIDFDRVKYSSMNETQKEKVCEILSDALTLNEPDNDIKFMKTIHCLVKSLEENIFSQLKLGEYINFINDINMASSCTLECILSDDPAYGLNSAITDLLLENKEYSYYIVGKILFEKKFVYPMHGISDENLLKLYYAASPVQSYLAEEKRFMQSVMDKKLYTMFQEPVEFSIIEPLRKLEQTVDFVRYVINTFNDSQVMEYLASMNTIVDGDSSLGIYRLLSTSQNIHLVAPQKVFDNVQYKLWDNTKLGSGYKSSFSKNRNKYLKKQNK